MPRRTVTDWWDEHGAQALALGGGVLCLLGVAFLYLFADQRGWIGDGLRVALGSAVSLALVAAGIALDRRHGHLHAAVAAVGVGLAGLYVSLYAAAGLYDMLPGSAALLLAGLIAAAGIGLSLAWSRETLAGFAILGAIAVPAIADGALLPLGVAFAFVLYCAAALLMARRRWWRLFQASALVLLVEDLVVSPRPDDVVAAWPIVLTLAAFVAVAVAAAVLYALQVRRRAVPVEVAIQLLAALLVTFATVRTFVPLEPAGGIALLIAGLAFAAPGFALLRRDRDLASVLAASGMLLAGVGLGEALHGGWRVAAFAARGGRDVAGRPPPRRGPLRAGRRRPPGGRRLLHRDPRGPADGCSSGPASTRWPPCRARSRRCSQRSPAPATSSPPGGFGLAA